MDLPELKGSSTVKVKVCGHEYTLRHAQVGDFETIQRLSMEGKALSAISIYMFAQLMYGYSLKFSKRLKHVKKLQVAQATDALAVDKALIEAKLYKIDKPKKKGAKKKIVPRLVPKKKDNKLPTS